MNAIVNAAPMTIFQGTDDKSTRALVPEAEALPTHLPKVYLYTKKGPTKPQMVSGASRSIMYGEDSFDLRKKWANHATVLSNTVNSQGNAQMIQRIEPADAGPPASVRIWLDLLPTQVPVYQRNSDGSYTLDVDGNRIPTGSTVAGFKGKFIRDWVKPTQQGDDTFGQATQKPGDQTEGGNQSVRYPILDTRAPYFGEDGNNFGLRLWAPTSKSSIAVSEAVIENEKVYPFRMACVYRADINSTAKTVETMQAEQYVDVCLRPNTIDHSTDSLLYVGDKFIQAYQDLDNPVNPPQYGPFGEVHVYDSDVAQVLQMLYNAEVPFIDQFSDITGVTDGSEDFLMNVFGGVSSAGVPYHSFDLITSGTDVVRMSESSTIYAQGGSDGTMNDTLFAQLVADAVVEYANVNSYLQDTAKYPESIIYDSGFPLATKYALCSFISLRKDTFVVLSTYDVNGAQLTASQESSLAVALRTRLQMYPESEYFGTSTMRGMIVGRNGRMKNTQYTKRLPLTLEIAYKAAAYMGAGNGRWKAGFAFDAAPASQVALFTDINVTFTPAPARNKDWDAGLVWVQSYDRRSFFFPALKTVYDKDTSVLNSFFTALACVELQKVGERSWRRFTGSANLTNAQLVERVNQFVIDNTIGRFDGRFTIEPETYFTAADIARGYSWSLRIKIYAPNLKTVATLSLEAHRIEELATTN